MSWRINMTRMLNHILLCILVKWYQSRTTIRWCKALEGHGASSRAQVHRPLLSLAFNATPWIIHYHCRLLSNAGLLNCTVSRLVPCTNLSDRWSDVSFLRWMTMIMSSRSNSIYFDKFYFSSSLSIAMRHLQNKKFILATKAAYYIGIFTNPPKKVPNENHLL